MKKNQKLNWKPFSACLLSILTLTACDNGYSAGGRAGTGALLGGGTGAAIGALAGGGKGAAIGALSGGALGAGVGALTTPNRPPPNYNNKNFYNNYTPNYPQNPYRHNTNNQY